jgi:hypothetical protein
MKFSSLSTPAVDVALEPRPTFDPIRHITRAAAARTAGKTPRTLANWERTRGLRPIHFNARLVGYDKMEFQIVLQACRGDVLPSPSEMEAFPS